MRPKLGRTGKRLPPHRYTVAELHAMCVDDYATGVHTRNGASEALIWFTRALERVAAKRGCSVDSAFLDVVHDAQEKIGRPIL
jgi:hypothetical protein